MKRFTFFMALLVSCSWLAEPCQAQTLSERIENIYEPLNKRAVQSGVHTISYNDYREAWRESVNVLLVNNRYLARDSS